MGQEARPVKGISVGDGFEAGFREVEQFRVVG